MQKTVLVMGALLAMAVMAIAPVTPAFAVEFETNDHSGLPEIACKKIEDAVARGANIPGMLRAACHVD